MTVTVDTSTYAQATAYSNQKKITKLSGGQFVLVFASTAATAEFWYSADDGATWTQFPSGTTDVGGWINGAISDAWTDTGGVQRVGIVWKQSGTSGAGPTGGARTDLRLYVAVGTFNAGATTLTWGAYAFFSGATLYNFADISAHANGTGGYIHIVHSGADTTPKNVTYYWGQPVDSSGVLQAGVATLLSPSPNGYVINIPTMPSICFDPATFRLFAGWNAGKAGVGFGWRFSTASFAQATAGSAWDTEVGVDNSYYVSDNENEGMACRWDALNSLVVLGGYLFDGAATRKALIYDSPSPFTTFTNRVSTTLNIAVGLTGFGMAIDNGDVYLFGSVFSSGSYNNATYYKATRSGSTLTLGAQQTLETFTGGANAPHTSATPGASKMGVAWAKGSASPFDVRFNNDLSVTPSGNTHQVITGT